mmetsp:Transcript_510/g.520  ORF Transcript_510/g.520 Transcript_510/m.520 type:complete len:81 (-) Transcript_510:1303-1545(-)|eukprot:CAMPEP_0170483486 /NCGR_PEP_ID=MMETSP0208-20121228/3154_1 /TAXON_ID=197538 /ORGANISM="Strombidium inclinatum, Strain S3" /LENGTH=80 /DNA_ID=CAMNT_0010756541 /DNA_START=231 /DNA_END=473 /DNA_ORIENTATION=-
MNRALGFSFQESLPFYEREEVSSRFNELKSTHFVLQESQFKNQRADSEGHSKAKPSYFLAIQLEKSRADARALFEVESAD